MRRFKLVRPSLGNARRCISACAWRRLACNQTMPEDAWKFSDRVATAVAPPVASVTNSTQIATSLRTGFNLTQFHQDAEYGMGYELQRN